MYGLDSPLTGPRWLELFGDPPDGSPTWVSLSHQSADGRSLIHVTTYVRRTKRLRAWPVASWRVDGVSVLVPSWRFAGGWTAFTDAAAGVYLSVVGIGPRTDPEGLSVAALRDGSAYHFDLHAPLSLELAKASAVAAGVPVISTPSWLREDWHTDQSERIRELAQD